MDRKRIFVVPQTFRGIFIIRFVIGSYITNEEDITFAWGEINSATSEIIPIRIENIKLSNGYVKRLENTDLII